jgi:hypothetical protein
MGARETLIGEPPAKRVIATRIICGTGGMGIL